MFLSLYFLLVLATLWRDILALDLSEHEDIHADSIFYDFANDNEFLDFIQVAESQLKIYIYPIPAEASTIHGNHDMLGHFQIEYLFRKYLYALNDHVPSDDPRRVMIVDDPSKANAFLIDHDYMRLVRGNQCDDLRNKHMKVIIDNVVNNLPYFNRTNGADHFFMAVYDNGYCAVTCEQDVYQTDKSLKTSVFYRLLKANAIGNYGMDAKTFEGESPDKVFPCHRPNHDIVVPQLFQDDSSKEFFLKYHKGRVSYREFDSSFSGASWGERKPLEYMVVSPERDFANGTENFIALTTDPKYKLNGNPDNTLIYRSYFMYDPCKLRW